MRLNSNVGVVLFAAMLVASAVVAPTGAVPSMERRSIERTDATGGHVEAPANVAGATNYPPVAVAEANRTAVEVGQAVFFDGSNSSDPDGDALTYEWDFDRDGTVDATGINATHAYDSPGTYNATLIVSDGSANDTDVVQVSVAPSLEEGLVGHWKFDDENTSKTAIDSAGSNDGTIHGAEYVPSGSREMALEFNESDDVTLDSDVHVDGSRTFTMWMGIEDSATTNHLVTDMGGPGDRGWWIGTTDAGELRWGGSDDGSDARIANRTSTNASLATFTWYHVAVVYNQSAREVALYLDGERLADDNGTVYDGYYDANVSTKFGESALGNFTGRLDDVRVYNRTLSDAGVAALYEETRNEPPTAVAAANRTTVEVGEPVFFDGSNSSDPDGDDLFYEWEFDDGTNATGVNATHAFDSTGTYLVELAVYDGVDSDFDVIEITVGNATNEGLVGHWKFDDENTSKTAIDSAGSNDGTISGAEYVSTSRGMALEFNDSDAVTLDSDVLVDESRTFALWVGVEYNRTDYLLTDMGGPGDRGWWLLVTESGEVRWGGSNDTSDANLVNRTSTNASIEPWIWYHVVVVYDQPAREVTLYLDGERLADDGGPVHASYANSTEPTRFGQSFNGSFDGVLDDVRVYNRTLSDAAVADLYNATK